MKDTQVIALNPAHMTVAQDSLLTHVDNEIREADAQMVEIGTTMRAHRDAGFASANKFKKLALVARQRSIYYRKVKAALEAGYYIIPPFPVELFAIRTDARLPRRGDTDGWNRQHQQEAKALPAGEGQYVSDLPAVDTYQEKNGKVDASGKALVSTYHYAADFRTVEFPVLMVRPEIIEATHQAMKLRIFDRLGILPAQRHNVDPIIVGQIMRPHIRYSQPMTFFVAWWLNKADI